MADRGVLSTRQRTTSTLVEIYQDIVALLTCDFVCQPLPELNGMPGVYLIRQGNDHFQVIGIGIVTVIQLDVLADFMHLQCVGFQYPFDCRLDTCYRCIKQLGNLPCGHPHLAIGGMDTLSVVSNESSFHSRILFE